MIDSHAHLHDKAFNGDRAEVFARAAKRGIRQIINVGCSLEDSARALAVAREFGGYATVGIHPHEASEAPSDLAAAFAPFLADPLVVAIGETGLDYFYEHSPKAAQLAVLQAHLELARSHAKPLVFHHRDAFDDFLPVLQRSFTPGMRGVVHCFTGNTQQAQTYVRDFGLKLGIGGVITFKSAQSIREAVAAVGIDHCILETDCPYLAPVPHRGARNEPAFIADTAQALATVLGIALEDVLQTTTRNAAHLFNLPL